MILMIDWGNSYLKYIEINSLSESSIIGAQIKKAETINEFSSNLLDNYEQILVSSVRENNENIGLKQCLNRKTDNLYFAKTSHSACGIRCAYQEPSILGIDRWLAVLVAGNSFERVGLISIGTAITVDLVIEQQHIGGQIIPGKQLMLDSLMATGQVRVKQINERPNKLLLGQSTSECVNFGIDTAISGYLEAVLSQIEKHYKVSHWMVTGGGAIAIDSIPVLKNRHIKKYPYIIFNGLEKLYYDQD